MKMLSVVVFTLVVLLFIVALVAILDRSPQPENYEPISAADDAVDYRSVPATPFTGTLDDAMDDYVVVDGEVYPLIEDKEA